MSRNETILACGILACCLMLLAAHVLILPPYEGWDETAHYSYISVLADRGRIPIVGKTPLDATMQEENRAVPTPYATCAPFEKVPLTYQQFHRRSREDRSAALASYWQARPASPVRYRPGAGTNWQAQHPPLFYGVMALPYRACRSWPPGLRLLWLRLWAVLPVAGSVLFWLASVRVAGEDGRVRRFVLLGGLAALFIPSWSFDLARLGNDGLVALLASATLYRMLSLRYRPGRWRRDVVGLAIVLGLGLATKHLFIPVAVAAMAYCAGWMWFGQRASWGRIALSGLILALGCVALAGGPYGLSYARYGRFIESEERIGIREGRFLADGLKRDANGEVVWPGEEMSVGDLVKYMARDVAGVASSFLWSSTWSMLRRPWYHYLLWVPLGALWLRGLVAGLRRGRIRFGFWAIPALVCGGVVAGLLHHIVITTWFIGPGAGTPGYQLHAVWPAVGMLFALAWTEVRSRPVRAWAVGAYLLVLAFELWGQWLLLLMYTGHLAKIGDARTGVGSVWPAPRLVADVLSRAGETPGVTVGLCLFALAVAARLCVLAMAVRLPEPE